MRSMSCWSHVAGSGWSARRGRQLASRILLITLLLALSGCLLPSNAGVHAFESDELIDDGEFVSDHGSRVDASEEAASLNIVGAGAASTRGKRAAAQSGEGLAEQHVQFPLEHALLQHGTEFTLAGYFTARVKTSVQGVQKLKRLQLERLELSQAEKAALEELIASDGFYRVRIPSDVAAPSTSSQYVLASTKARCLAAGQLAEHLDLHMDSAGHIEALTYLPEADCSKPHGASPPATWRFSSTASVKKGKKAPQLFSTAEAAEATVLPAGGPPLRPGETPPEKQPEKTFWQKYWIYIIPGALVIINGLASGAPPDAPAGGGGGAGGGASRAAAGGGRRR